MAAASTWANRHRTERSDAYGVRFFRSLGLSCVCRDEAAVIRSLLHPAPYYLLQTVGYPGYISFQKSSLGPASQRALTYLGDHLFNKLLFDWQPYIARDP